MAKFDVYKRRNGPGYLLDCQADVLRYLDTRLVVPLLPLNDAPRVADRLNPVFDIGGQTHMMATQFAASVDKSRLVDRVTSLSSEDIAVTNALDMLISGF